MRVTHTPQIAGTRQSKVMAANANMHVALATPRGRCVEFGYETVPEHESAAKLREGNRAQEADLPRLLHQIHIRDGVLHTGGGVRLVSGARRLRLRPGAGGRQREAVVTVRIHLASARK